MTTSFYIAAVAVFVAGIAAVMALDLKRSKANEKKIIETLDKHMSTATKDDPNEPARWVP